MASGIPKLEPRYSSDGGATTTLAGMPLSIPPPMLEPNEAISTSFMRIGAARSLISLFAERSAGRWLVPARQNNSRLTSPQYDCLCSSPPSLLLSIASIVWICAIVQSIDNRYVPRLSLLPVQSAHVESPRATLIVANSTAASYAAPAVRTFAVLPRGRRHP